MQPQPGGHPQRAGLSCIRNRESSFTAVLIRVKKQDWQDNLNRYTNEHTPDATHPKIKNQDREKRIFRYQEVVILFSAYIIRRKDLLFLPNNQLVARVDLDPPLGLALGGIKRLHRSQASKMIRDQLIPVS